MRVIAGSARGRKLRTPEGNDFRPTTDRVKEAMFSIVHFDLDGARVLDLFSGSGQMGIEALSRGAAHCVFVDSSRDSFEITKENVTNSGFYNSSRLLMMDSIEYLKLGRHQFDVVILDPPYNKGILLEVLPLLERLVADGGKVLCEHEQGLVLPESVGRLELKKKYRYGKIEVTLYHIPIDTEEE